LLKTTKYFYLKHTKVQLPGKHGASWYSISVTQRSDHTARECGSFTMNKYTAAQPSAHKGCSTKTHRKPSQLRS